MTHYFPFTCSQSLRKSLNKSLTSFFPAMLTQQAVTGALNKVISEPWSNAIFASLTVLFSRFGEINADKAYAQSSLEALFITKETNCQLSSAESLLAQNIDAIEAQDKLKLQNYLASHFDIDLTKPADRNKLVELLSWAVRNDVFKMIAAGVVCYYMPIPTVNPVLSKVFNASIASVTAYGIDWMTRSGSCRFFSAKSSSKIAATREGYCSVEDLENGSGYTLQVSTNSQS